MLYILEHKCKNGEIKYVLTAESMVYCPELAASYECVKEALTEARKYIREKYYTNLRVVELSFDLVAVAHKRHGGDLADKILLPYGRMMKRDKRNKKLE